MSNITKKPSSEMEKLLEDKQYFNLPKVGDLVKGTIISAQKNEVHLDLNGLATGIIRGKECYTESEEYRNLKAGDQVEATVMELENENGDLELSFKYAGRQKAWQIIHEHMKDADLVTSIITDANKGGLMIRVENTAGFLPVSQLAPEHYPRVPGGDKNRILEILKGYVGQKFSTKVIDADENEDRLIVSEKAAWEETQKDVMSKYSVGSIVEGVVTAVTDFGVFVEFSDKLEGLVHISEIAWQRIDNPHDFVKVGEKVKAEIIAIEKSKIFLSIKKLLSDPWTDVEKKYKIGQKVRGQVIKINPFGLFVELDKDIHGLAHISQLSDKPVKNINDVAKIGDDVDFYVISIDPRHHRLGLSLVKPKEKSEKVEKAEAKEEVSAPTEEKKEPKAKKQKKEEKLDDEKVADDIEEAAELPETKIEE